MFRLSHVTVQQRLDNERVTELLQAIKEKNITLDNIRHASHPLCKSPLHVPESQPVSESEEIASVGPHSPTVQRPASPGGHSKPHGDTVRPKEPPSPAVFPDKSRGSSEGHLIKKNSSLLNSLRAPLSLQAKEGHQSINGRTKSWDSFTPEEFAQQFHESVLQSTQKALQKHKGGSSSTESHLLETSVHYNIPELQSTPARPAQSHTNSVSRTVRHTQANGQHFSGTTHRETSGRRGDVSGPEDSEADEEEEEEAPTSKWQGIESIFEAYQEYAEERNLERQILENQCRRLEAQNYNLSLTAEQLSHSMGEIVSQRQRLAAEREKLQAELEHFRKCLTLPQTQWPRGSHYKGYPPR